MWRCSARRGGELSLGGLPAVRLEPGPVEGTLRLPRAPSPRPFAQEEAAEVAGLSAVAGQPAVIRILPQSLPCVCLWAPFFKLFFDPR